MRRAALALFVVLAACGSDDDEPTLDGEWDVVLVVGAAIADPAADASGFPGEGSDATERWTFDCGDDGGCELSRPPGGLLGDLDGLRVEPADGSVRGEAAGVQPPRPLEIEPCTGSAAETWTVRLELTLDGDTFVGSMFRIPDALVDGDCFGLDLTLGLSGSRVP